MMRHRRAKIVATLGPASSDAAMIRTLFDAGVDVFRLNFSHGAHDAHKARVDAIRAVEAEVGRPIAILADLQGPKIRVGAFQSGRAMLNSGARFRLDLDPAPGDVTRAPLLHPEIFAALKPDTDILLDDGRIRLKVETIGSDFVETMVLVGGEISDRKGVNLPRLSLPMSPLTKKDRRDLHFALDLGVDWIALSFVQRPEDVAEAKNLIQGRASVMTKLEKPAALAQLDEIIALSDALMVARGDLGVELDPEDVPIEQKRIVRDCRRAGKPVVVATQMLESMIRAPAPTRAEASDVATAVYDGADALMLSAETASGAYPREAVAMMNRIIERVERDADYRRQLESQHTDPEATAADAITAAASQVAATIKAACIVTYTSSGSTALRAARERPSVPVLALTPLRATARRLALTWGVHCVETEDARSFTEMVEKAAKVAREQEIAKPGERIVVTAGVPFGTPGATNILRIAWVVG
ncbi:MAG: pyruvate kinase [Alphaproteobacteria bacterium]|nr:pyruvate kinase [Alphaproteobacteria bacterium]